MKKLKIIISLFTVLMLVSCKGDTGDAGGVLLGKVFEVTVDFIPQNGYTYTFKYPKGMEVYEADVVLAYLLDDNDENINDIWIPLPKVYFLNNLGTMNYTFDYSFIDVQLLLDADFPLGELPSAFTHRQTFRIAVVPMEYAEAGLSMEELVDSKNIEWIK